MKNRHEIGIELTRLNPASRNIPDENQLAQIQLREQIIGLSQDLFEKTSPLKLFVKFIFSDSKDISEERQMSVAVQSVNLIRNAVIGKSSDSFFRELIPVEVLPYGLDEILIVNHPVMQISAWERANNLGVSNDVFDDIMRTIHKKDGNGLNTLINNRYSDLFKVYTRKLYACCGRVFVGAATV